MKCPSESSGHLLLLEAKMPSCKVPFNYQLKGNWKFKYYLVLGQAQEILVYTKRARVMKYFPLIKDYLYTA